MTTFLSPDRVCRVVRHYRPIHLSVVEQRGHQLVLLLVHGEEGDALGRDERLGLQHHLGEEDLLRERVVAERVRHLQQEGVELLLVL